jgi:hypothetical protein
MASGENGVVRPVIEFARGAGGGAPSEGAKRPRPCDGGERT